MEFPLLPIPDPEISSRPAGCGVPTKLKEKEKRHLIRMKTFLLLTLTEDEKVAFAKMYW